jgi:hypothetical protein
MLEQLDKIDWSKVNHCYGPATDFPTTLRALATGDKEQRKRSLWELHGNIWHQGTVYEATAPAVPFLIELVKSRHADSLEILCLLALIADGKSYMAVHMELLRGKRPEDEQQMLREIQWVTAAKKAVTQGRPLYMELMSGDDQKIREISIFLLGLTCADQTVDFEAVHVIEAMMEG